MNSEKNTNFPHTAEGREPDERSERAKRERALDRTIAGSFPASDPPSSLPNPNEDSPA